MNESAALEGAAADKGLYKCAECRETFTVTVNTVMEDSHIPLNKWLIAFYMMMSSKTQISALQLQRHLELGSYRSAWFMCQRIRFALSNQDPGGKLDGVVEVDETWIGGIAKNAHGNKVPPKTAVIALIERGGRVRSKIVPRVDKDTAGVILKENVDYHAILNTDESRIYPEAGSYFAAHDTVNHSKDEYVRRDKETGRVATINSAESFFGNTKRSIDGTHHSVSRKHLPLYMAEFDHKYNTRDVTDGERTVIGIAKVDGKRLTLRPAKTGKE